MSRKLFVGIEIGGTNVSLAARDEKNSFIEESVTSEEADYRSDGDFTKQIDRLRRDLARNLGTDVGFIARYAIASTGQPTAEGTIKDSANAPFEMTFPRELLGEIFIVVNDVAGAAFGAKDYGYGSTRFKKQGTPRWDSAMTIGTGINIQSLMNGELLCNPAGASNESGHDEVDSRYSGDLCGCGARGCIEAYSAGSGIRNRASKLMTELYIQSYKEDAEKMIANERILQEAKIRLGDTPIEHLILHLKAVDVFNAYKNSDKKDVSAVRIVHEGIDKLAQYLGNAARMMPSIPYVEVFGTMAEKDPWYVNRTVTKWKKTPELWGNRDPNEPNTTKFLVTNVDRLGLRGVVALAYHEAQKAQR